MLTLVLTPHHTNPRKNRAGVQMVSFIFLGASLANRLPLAWASCPVAGFDTLHTRTRTQPTGNCRKKSFIILYFRQVCPAAVSARRADNLVRSKSQYLLSRVRPLPPTSRVLHSGSDGRHAERRAHRGTGPHNLSTPFEWGHRLIPVVLKKAP